MKHRKEISKSNEELLRRNQYLVRPKCRIALDTNCLQLLRNEKVEIVSSTEVEWAGRPLIVNNAETVNPKRSPDQMAELACLNALCQLAVDKQIELVMLPSINEEMKGEAFSHTHGKQRLDRDVNYSYPDIQCARMRFMLTYVVRPDSEKLNTDCIADISKFQHLIAHASGAGQKKDVWHFIQADLLGSDLFLSVDKKFIRAFRDVEDKIREVGVRTLLMTPTEFCRDAKIQPIAPPKSNPRSARGADPAY